MSSQAIVIKKEREVEFAPPSKPIDIANLWRLLVKRTLETAEVASSFSLINFLSDERVRITEEESSFEVPAYPYFMSLLTMNSVQSGICLDLKTSKGSRTPPLDVIYRGTPEESARNVPLAFSALQTVLFVNKTDYDILEKARGVLSDKEYQEGCKQILSFARRQVDFFIIFLNQSSLSALSHRIMEVLAKQPPETPFVPKEG